VNTAAEPTPQKDFWHPPLWKWPLFLLLAGVSFWLFRYHPAPRPLKIELLSLSYPTPTWDGSYPRVVFSPISGVTGALKFNSTISMKKPTVRHDSPVDEFEVALDSGIFGLRQTDLFVTDVMPLALTRTYRAWDGYKRAFGVGSNHPYDICPTGTRFPYTYMNLNLEDNRALYFPRISKGTGYADAVFGHYATLSEFYQAKIAWNGNGWTLDFHDGRRFLFPEAYYSKSYAQGAPIEMQDENGNRIELKRDKVRNLEELISPSRHTIHLKYDASDRIVEAADDGGHIRRYSYDASGHLETVGDASHLLYRFEYEPLLHSPGYDPYLMTIVRDGSGSVLLRNVYRDYGRISEQRLADGSEYRYEYLFDKKYNVVETMVTLPSGEVKRFFFKNGILAMAK